MIINFIKDSILKFFGYFGYEIRKIPPKKTPSEEEYKLFLEFDYSPATINRPIGDLNTFFRDIRERGFDCKYVLDIGSNKTQWSRLLKKAFPDAVFFLIDPIIEMKDYLDKFCDESKGSEYMITAVGSAPGKKTLTLSGDFYEGSTLIYNEFPGLKKNNRQREADIVTIDSLIENKKLKRIPDIVKIDVQGFELEVLKGSELLFGKTDLFIIEVSLFKFNEFAPVILDVIKFMADRNYTIYDIPGFLRRPLDGALGQLDVGFVRNGSHLKSSNKWAK